MSGPAFLKLPSYLWPRTIAETTPNIVENLSTTETDDKQTYSLICNTQDTFVDYRRFSSLKSFKLRTTFYILKTLDLAKLSTIKERYQRSKDILSRVTKTGRHQRHPKNTSRQSTQHARLSTATHIATQPTSKSPNQLSNKKPSNRRCQALHHTTLNTTHTRR